MNLDRINLNIFGYGGICKQMVNSDVFFQTNSHLIPQVLD